MNNNFNEHTEIYHCCRWCRHFNTRLESCVRLNDEIIVDSEEGWFPADSSILVNNPYTFYCRYFES